MAKKVQRLGLDKWVRCVDWVPRSEMPLLYQGARALVFPSLYEGFGLPVLEAQRIGIPVAASNTASIPEVAGEGAFLFDPKDPEALRDAVTRVVEDDSLRDDLIIKGRQNEQRYSWNDSAQIMCDTYDEMGFLSTGARTPVPYI